MSYLIPKFHEMTEDLDDEGKSKEAKSAIVLLIEYMIDDDLLEVARIINERTG